MKRLISVLLAFCLVTNSYAQIGRRSDPFATASIEGTSVGDETPLTYLGISPTGATLPTASSLAIQDNSTSGTQFYQKSTPGSSSSATMMLLEADGTNWATNSEVLALSSDSSNCDPLRIFSGSSEYLRISRYGTITGVQGAQGLTVATLSNGDITLAPNGSGNVVASRPVILGADGATQGTLNLWDGSGGNTPAYILMHSPNGSAWYLFIEDDGTVKVHNAAPTANGDGSAIGDQTD